MRNLIIKIIVASIIIVSCTIFISIYNKSIKNDSEGTCYITITSVDDNSVTKEIKYHNQSLFDVLDSNYNLRYEQSSYGIVLYDIDHLKTDFATTYLAIYVDGQYSNYGISQITLYDGIKIEIKETKI